MKNEEEITKYIGKILKTKYIAIKILWPTCLILAIFGLLMAILTEIEIL